MVDEHNKAIKPEYKHDKAESLLINQEEALLGELKEVQSKCEDITLVYDRIKDNIKSLIRNDEVVRLEKKNDDSTIDLNNTTTVGNETSNNQETRNDTIKVSEDGTKVEDENDFIFGFSEFLKRTKKSLTDVFLSVLF